MQITTNYELGGHLDDGYVWECVRGTPPKIKSALIAEAKKHETNVNDVAVRILADEFGYTYEPTQVRKRLDAQRNTEYRTLMLRLPQELSDTLRIAAVSSRLPARRDFVLAILAKHLGVSYLPPAIRKGKRHPRGKRSTVAA